MIANHRVVLRMHGLVDRDILADRIVRSNDDLAYAGRDIGVLGNAADDGPLEKVIPFAQSGAALDDDMAFQNTILADGHVVLDHAKGADASSRRRLEPRGKPTPKDV